MFPLLFINDKKWKPIALGLLNFNGERGSDYAPEVFCAYAEHATLQATPAGSLRTGCGSRLSRKILFVAICRSFGLPARIARGTLAAEYCDGARFAAAEAESRVFAVCGASDFCAAKQSRLAGRDPCQNPLRAAGGSRALQRL